MRLLFWGTRELQSVRQEISQSRRAKKKRRKKKWSKKLLFRKLAITLLKIKIFDILKKPDKT
jgi:hypothetical protein